MIKKLLISLCIVFISVMPSFGQNPPPEFKEDTLYIRTAEDLVWASKTGNEFYNKTIFLEKDIDMTGQIEFRPIGGSGVLFKGTFDGNGKTIKNLNMSAQNPAIQYFGVIAYLDPGREIKNLTVENCTITLSDIHLNTFDFGFIAGFSKGSIKNCHSKNNILNIIPAEPGPPAPGVPDLPPNFHVGGIVGFVDQNNNSVENCISESILINITSDDTQPTAKYLGGICGYSKALELKNCIVSEVWLNNVRDKGFVVGNITGKCETANALNNFSANLNHTNNFTSSKENGQILEGKFRIISSAQGILEDTSCNGFIVCKASQTPFESIEVNTESSIELLSMDAKTDIFKIGENSSVILKGSLAVNKFLLNGEFLPQGAFCSEELHLGEKALLDYESGIKNNGAIIYHRNISTFAQKNKSGGWETICLPFDAHLYANETELKPVFTDLSGKYWIREHAHTENPDAVGFLSMTSTDYTGIKGDTPYIIALPGNSYGSLSLENALISFRGYGDIKPRNNTNPESPINSGNFRFIGSLSKTEKENEFRYLLNNKADGFGDPFDEPSGNNLWGHSFHRTNNGVHPFRACFVEKTNGSFAPEQLLIVNGISVPNDLSPETEYQKRIKVYSVGNVIYIDSKSATKIAIFDITGYPAREIFIQEGITAIEGLSKGIYIIEGVKIIL